MFATLRTLMSRWFGPAQAHGGAIPTHSPSGHTEVIHAAEHQSAYPVPYDENLLERARTQWQFGDWQSLAALNRDTLQHHPDRAKLALLAAAGHMQQGDTHVARQFICLAQDWGCSKKLVSQILIAGVHNTLGRAAATSGEELRARQHFEAAIASGTPGSDIKLLTQARLGEQFSQLGLAVPADIHENSDRPRIRDILNCNQ